MISTILDLQKVSEEETSVMWSSIISLLCRDDLDK